MSAEPPPALGLTGGLGAGKSTALAAFGRLGAATLSSDQVVHDLYAGDARLLDAVIDRWGVEVAPGGLVDRRAIARRVFADDDERGWLERLIWPMVATAIADFRVHHSGLALPPRAIVIESPLLFEAGLSDSYDATVAVIADEATRRARAAARGHELIDARNAAQLSQDEKALRATYVVRNDGSETHLERQLSDILDMLGR